MPKEVHQKMEYLHNYMEKVPHDDKSQYHGKDQDNQLKELGKCNTR